MSLRQFLAAIGAVIMLITVASAPAAATDLKRPDGWAHERAVRHWVYYPRYHHVYHSNSVTDPYGYKYEPRGYYPYYNSGYWRSRRDVGLNRPHYKHPTYHKAWGAKRKWYKHYRWHAKHHGRHDHAHW